MKIAAGIEYCGTRFFGWQRQNHAPSIQQHVEEALSKVADHTVQIQCAGRTDAGVHALYQVIHFETSAEREARSWVFGGNTHMSSDVSLLWAQHVADDFHARFSATSRTYRYIILNRPIRPGISNGLVSWEYRVLDEKLMASAAADLVGEHDFTSYRATACQANSSVRNVQRLDVYRKGDYVLIDIEANAFLHHMVRNIAGVLMTIGIGKEDIGWTKRVLDAKDRNLGGVTAPAAGLYLIDVKYPSEYKLPEANRTNWPFIGE